MGSRHHHISSSSSSSSRRHALEDRVAAQHRSIQTLLVDNQRLAAVHLALKQDLSDAHQLLRQLSAASVKVKADSEARVREVLERSLKLESELRSIEAMAAELGRVRGDAARLAAAREELAGKLKAVEGDIGRALEEAQRLPVAVEEIEGMHHEIQRGRAAIEYEKKTHARNLEHAEAMEKNLTSVAREVEYLRAQLAEAEKRAQAAAVNPNPNPSGGYAATYGNHELGYGGGSYPGHYSHYGMHQAPGGVGVGASPQFAPGSAIHHPYSMQQTDMPR